MLEKKLLGGFSFFSDIPQEYLSQINEIGKISEFDLNQTVFQYGDKAVNFYGVVDGEVELSITLKDQIIRKNIQYEEFIHTHTETVEKEIIFDLIEPGDVFGWSAFANPKVYTKTATCSQSSRIVSLPTDKLEVIFK